MSSIPLNSELPRTVVIGGGTGSATVLRGLSSMLGDRLSAVLGMADNGGSTGELRDEYGILPPGDVMQAIDAMSTIEGSMRGFTRFRYPEGKSRKPGLVGHSIGNLLLQAAVEHVGGYQEGIDGVATLLGVKGRVLPVTYDNAHLQVELPEDGRVVTGEHELGELELSDLKGILVGYDRPVRINPLADEAIRQADLIVIAPGDIYTSIAPALAVNGMKEALEHTRAVRVQVTNLMNRNQHTVGFTAYDYAKEINRIAGTSAIDYILYNAERLKSDLINRYDRVESGRPVHIGLPDANFNSVGMSLIASAATELVPNDPLASSRSLIRHDSGKLALALLQVYRQAEEREL